MRIGRIYKVVALHGPEIYVGSTFNTIEGQFEEHKRKYNIVKNNNYIDDPLFYLYDMFDMYEINGCRIMLIKEYEVIDKAHLCVYESLWISKLEVINMNHPFAKLGTILSRVYRIRYKEKKDKMKQQRREYREQMKVMRKIKKIFNVKG